MAVASVSIPKYCRHNASGRASVKIQGKRHYFGRFGTPDSKERYARLVAELAASPVAPAAVVPTKNAAGLTRQPVTNPCRFYHRIPRNMDFIASRADPCERVSTACK